MIYIYIKLTSFLPMLVLAIPTFIPFFRNVFSLVHVAFSFVDMKYQNGLNHRRRYKLSDWCEAKEEDETTLPVYINMVAA